MTDSIKTETFKTSPAAYLMVTAAGVFSRLLIFAVLLTIASAIGAIFDLRWLLIGLILLLLFMPFAIFHIYLSRLLTPEASLWLAPKQITIIPGESILISFPAEESESPVIPPRHISWRDISKIGKTGKYLTISIDNEKQPILIPLSSLPADCDYRVWFTPYTY